MNIKYKNFFAENIDGRFDLYQERVVTANKDSKDRKKGDKYQKLILVGYGYKFESMLRKIIEVELSQRKKVVTIAEYLKEFKVLSATLNDTLR